MKNPHDKNGNLLKGATKWTRALSEDGGLEKHDEKIWNTAKEEAVKAFSEFLDKQPGIDEVISRNEKQKKKERFKLIK